MGYPRQAKLQMIKLSYIWQSLDKASAHHPSSMAAPNSPLQFSMVVDGFGIKYERQEDITHLLYSLKTIYKISNDWDGKLYCGLK